MKKMIYSFALIFCSFASFANEGLEIEKPSLSVPESKIELASSETPTNLVIFYDPVTVVICGHTCCCTDGVDFEFYAELYCV